jgi:hypothetical protein
MAAIMWRKPSAKKIENLESGSAKMVMANGWRRPSLCGVMAKYPAVKAAAHNGAIFLAMAYHRRIVAG